MQEFNREELLKYIDIVLREKPRSLWLEGKGYRIFVRYSVRLLQDNDFMHKRFDCFDLANINFLQKGQGHFTALLNHLEEKLDRPLYVENVLGERFSRFFIRRGYYKYVPYRNYGEPQSFYKLVKVST